MRPCQAWLALTASAFAAVLAPVRLSSVHTFLVVQATASTYSFWGTLRAPGVPPASADFALCIIVTCIWVILSAVHSAHAHLARHPGVCSSPWLAPLVLPCAWVTAWRVVGLSPIGQFANPAATQVSFHAFAQLASVGGLDVMAWLMAYVASISSMALHSARLGGNAGPSRRRWRRTLGAHAAACALLMAAGLTFGHARMRAALVHEAALLERDAALHVTCLLRVSDTTASYPVAPEEALWNATAAAVVASPAQSLVLWSEAALNLHSPADEAVALTRAASIAASGHSFLGLSWYVHYGEHSSGSDDYYADIDDRIHTMFALFAPGTGRMVIRYIKAHPVPLADYHVVAGPAVAPLERDIPWGPTTVDICFDADFPDFVRQARGAALIMQPAQTWGEPAFGRRHFLGNSLRAIENGATLVRCGSDGFSGGVSPSGTLHGPGHTGHDGSYTFTVPWPADTQADTVFAAGGWLFGWACAAFTAAACAAAVGRHRQSYYTQPR
jgi:apolipoprotein N-acyltransferase